MVVLEGANHVFDRNTYVSLDDGSDKEDIIIGDHAMISGGLRSENHGKIRMGAYSYLREHSVVGSVKSVTIGDYTQLPIMW
jgi:hypothetical protein